MKSARMIIGNVVTEKSERLKVAGKRVYTIIVDNAVNKIELKEALKNFYDVDVQSVRIMRTTAKKRAFGKGNTMKKRASLKKALITLTADSKPLDITAPTVS